MDIRPIKPVPVVQPPRKIEREREEEHHKQNEKRGHEDDIENKDDEDIDHIDTYA